MALFTLPQMISRLTKGFVKVTGRKPDGLEKIKIKQEALERIKQQDKVVDMEGNVIDTSKGIMGGREIKAMGGRIGLRAGMSRRAFLKLMGGVGAGIGALKTGMINTAHKFQQIENKDVFGAIGGFHLFRSSEEDIRRVVTLSPRTDMARNFHLRNGAKEIAVHVVTANFEYEI